MACGVALAAAPAQERRKLVTVLFCDVTGSTALAERLDAETLRALMLRYFDEMRAAVERHGGTVEKFIGDAVAALFGVPLAHEDDALRAVRAAAEMQSRLGRLNDELDRRFGARLAIRIGINTGEVVAGAGDGPDLLASGDPVNVASRLQDAAEPGEILLGDQTHILVRDAAEVEPAGALSLRGKAEPVPAFRLRSVVMDGTAPGRAAEADLVGRRTELDALARALGECTGRRRARLVTVIGEPGVGKSRLAAEFVQSSGRQATVLTGRCLPYGEGITYWPLAEAVRQVAGIRGDDRPAQAQERIADLVAGDAEAGNVAELVAVAVGLSAAMASPEEIGWATGKVLTALAARRPVIFLLDDLQWAEPTFLRLVDRLRSLDGPVLLLALARPELLDTGAFERPAEDDLLILHPLSEAESADLVDGIAGDPLPGELRQRLVEVAGGNPLFLRELLVMLDDANLLHPTEGGRAAPGDLTVIPLPPTLDALLESRIDLLGETERRVLERASIEGKVFQQDAVEALSPPGARGAVTVALDVLSARGFVRPALSEGADAFQFHHLLVRDVVYRSIPKRRRAELHEHFASWVAQKTPGPATGLEEILGYHLEQACLYRRELGPPDEKDAILAARAAQLLDEAAARALGRSDLFAAIHLLRRAAAIVSEDEAARAEILRELGAALTEAGDLADAGRALGEALALARDIGSDRLRARTLVEQLILRLQTDTQGVIDDVKPVGDGARRLFEDDADLLGLCRLAYLEAQVSWVQGRCAAAEEAWDRAAACARLLGDERRLWDVLRWVPSLALFGPLPAQDAIRRCEALREEVHQSGRAQAEVLPALAGLYAMTGRFDVAERLLAETESLLDDLGFTVHSVPEWAAFVAMLAGDPATAERHLRPGYERLSDMGEKALLSTTAAWLARVRYDQGDDAEALSLSVESERLSAPGDVASQIAWRRVRARILAGRGDAAEAEAVAREAVALAGSTEFLSDRGDAELDLAEVLRAGGHPDRARSAAHRALDLYERKGNLVATERAQALLANLVPV
jgi:class 3 adenylate cyclase/tetratricopeptide (TPR) repeat protein